jgi:hypothetical protein
MRVSSKNVWGAANANQGLDQQRGDLWTVDFSQPIRALGISIDQPHIYAKSVKIPDLTIIAEPFRRDSRQYMQPMLDNAVDTLDMTFVYSVPSEGLWHTPMYILMDAWRRRVRAGRGGLSKEPALFISEENDFKVPFRWSIPIRFLRGNRNSDDGVTGLSPSTAFLAVNAWPHRLGLPELDYTNQGQATEIRASFYCEDILMIEADGIDYRLEGGVDVPQRSFGFAADRTLDA